jgi:hypothetical protein
MFSYAALVAGSTGALAEVGDVQRAAGAIERLQPMAELSIVSVQTNGANICATGKTSIRLMQLASTNRAARPLPGWHSE